MGKPFAVGAVKSWTDIGVRVIVEVKLESVGDVEMILVLGLYTYLSESGCPCRVRVGIV